MLKAGLWEIREYEALLELLRAHKTPVLLNGLAPVHAAHVVSVLRARMNRPVVLICSDETAADLLLRDIGSLTGEPCGKLVPREFTFFSVEGVSRQLEHQRLLTLHRMAAGAVPVVAATVAGLMQRCIPKDVLSAASRTLRAGETVRPEDLCAALVRGGYTRSELVEGPGQFSVRGGILDFYSPAHDRPVRCEFWGDEIDGLAFFDPLSQRRLDPVAQAVLLPAAEALVSLCRGGETAFCERLEALDKRAGRRKQPHPKLRETLQADLSRVREGRSFSVADRYMDLLYDACDTAVSYIDPSAVVVLYEPARLAERGKAYAWQLREDVKVGLESGSMDGSAALYYQEWPVILEQLALLPIVMLEQFASAARVPAPEALLSVTAKRLPSYGGSVDTAIEDAGHYIKSGYRTVVLCADERRGKLLQERLLAAGLQAALEYTLKRLPAPGHCSVTLGSLSAGLEYPGDKLAVITEGQIMKSGNTAPGRGRKGKRKGARISGCADLSPGDLVVHEHHGIGRFVGIFPMLIDGAKKDYIKLAYHGTDSLYVPATQLDLVSKYIGGGEDRPVKLSKMGGTDWHKTKSRAKSAAKDLAKGLLELYAQRQKLVGFAFSPDSEWQAEFEASFEYAETEDQLTCIREIKADMENCIPMDRILCGDVGYGKTEVALRAVMKCVLDGKQAAILVPTTVLAQQHYSTMLKRFEGYPVRIELISRFQSPAQVKRLLREMQSGVVDIVVGTHKLLQKNIAFKDLGLLIVDEEQRFGVGQKERLKERFRAVDVLTLSATPIPRTLNMAMSGIRDMSTIEEPPQNRQPVQTYVMEHDWALVSGAIRRELDRGGQVYYLHNRVETIERTAAKLKGLLDGARVGVAHGQMDEAGLKKVMERMIAGEIQILVCTTIIETGIDMPNVNTLVIEDADRFGLAQLHQIRGRVGRSPRRAFAYLTYRQGKILTEISAKRLSAIREFAEFNSGFKIALRDLEIRGAGNLLGPEQSGHMISVGYDMYLKLLDEAVAEEKGEPARARANCSAELAITANIPEDYISSEAQRMDFYRRIAAVQTQEDALELTDELIDRYGEPPEGVRALVSVALLRAAAARAGITEITQKAEWLHFTFPNFEMEQISKVYGLPDFKGRIRILAGDKPVIRLRLQAGKRVTDEAAAFIQCYMDQEALAE